MKKILFYTIILLLAATVLVLRYFDFCSYCADDWGEEAKTALADFKKVDSELRANGLVPSDFYFLHARDSSTHEGLPNTMHWLRTYPGYISYNGDLVTISYATCRVGDNTGHAHLYHSPTGIQPSFTKNLIAEINDSFNVEGNWYFIATSCLGCGD